MKPRVRVSAAAHQPSLVPTGVEAESVDSNPMPSSGHGSSYDRIIVTNKISAIRRCVASWCKSGAFVQN